MKKVIIIFNLLLIVFLCSCSSFNAQNDLEEYLSKYLLNYDSTQSYHVEVEIELFASDRLPEDYKKKDIVENKNLYVDGYMNFNLSEKYIYFDLSDNDYFADYLVTEDSGTLREFLIYDYRTDYSSLGNQELTSMLGDFFAYNKDLDTISSIYERINDTHFRITYKFDDAFLKNDLLDFSDEFELLSRNIEVTYDFIFNIDDSFNIIMSTDLFEIESPDEKLYFEMRMKQKVYPVEDFDKVSSSNAIKYLVGSDNYSDAYLFPLSGRDPSFYLKNMSTQYYLVELEDFCYKLDPTNVYFFEEFEYSIESTDYVPILIKQSMYFRITEPGNYYFIVNNINEDDSLTRMRFMKTDNSNCN